MMACQRNICDVVTHSYWKSLARLTAHCPYLVIPAESSNSMLCCTIMEKGLGNNQALLQPAPGGYNLRQHTLKAEPAGGSLILQERRDTRIDGGWMTMRCEQGQVGHCVLVRSMQAVWGPYFWSYICIRYDYSSISGGQLFIVWEMWDTGSFVRIWNSVGKKNHFTNERSSFLLIFLCSIYHTHSVCFIVFSCRVMHIDASPSLFQLGICYN